MILLIEGVDGVGKTALVDSLSAKIDAVKLATPSKGPLGIVIRDIQDSTPLSGRAMAYAYIADQFEVEEVLLRSCHERKHVVLDRHAMTSGPAYRPDEWGILWPQLKITQAFVKPDLGVVLEVENPKIIRERLANKNHPCPWSDSQLAHIAKRTRIYTQKFCGKTIILDATSSVEELCKHVIAAARDID